MKYIIYVLILSINAEGDISRTEFEIDMSSRDSCLEATTIVEEKVTNDWPDAQSIMVECRSQTQWDEPVSMTQFMQDDELVARQ